MEIRLRDIIKDGTFAPSPDTFAGLDDKMNTAVFEILNREPGVHKLVHRVKSIPGVNLNAYPGMHADINVNSHNIEIVIYRDSDIKDVVEFIYRLSKLNVKLCETEVFEYWVDFYDYSMMEHPYYIALRFNVRVEPKEDVKEEKDG